MHSLSRSTALKIAATLSFALGAYNFVSVLPILAVGEAGLNQDGSTFLYFIVVAGLIFAVLRIVGALGAWMRQRWGILITILANLLDGVLAAPGILFAPSLGWQIAAYVTVIAAVIIIILCLWRDRQAAVQ